MTYAPYAIIQSDGFMDTFSSLEEAQKEYDALMLDDEPQALLDLDKEYILCKSKYASEDCYYYRSDITDKPDNECGWDSKRALIEYLYEYNRKNMEYFEVDLRVNTIKLVDFYSEIEEYDNNAQSDIAHIESESLTSIFLGR